jgi:hypothetical protein
MFDLKWKQNKTYIFELYIVLEKIDTFSNTGPHKVPYVPNRCQYGQH